MNKKIKSLNEAKKRKDVLLEIETRGAKQVIDKMHSDDEISIFLVPPSLEELEKRIRGRKTETEDLIKKRMAKAKRLKS